MSQGSKRKLFIGTWATNIMGLLEWYGKVLFLLFLFAFPVIRVEDNISIYTSSNGNFFGKKSIVNFYGFIMGFRKVEGFF